MRNTLIIFFLTFILIEVYAQDSNPDRLENSPRHHEWVKVQSGERQVNCFVVFPEVQDNVPVVIIIHENRGLNDWTRRFADQVAEAGYIAIAPDLLSDFDSTRKKTPDFKSSDEARNALYELDDERIRKDLNHVQQYASELKAGNGKTIVAGFCWGGTQSFRFATYNHKVEAVLVFYGSAPEKELLSKITVPVFGFYGENDQRINAGIPATEQMMKELGKIYNYKIYNGAGHAYMRQGDNASGSQENKNARNDSWVRLKTILSEID